MDLLISSGYHSFMKCNYALLLILLFSSCGKLQEKFGRLEKGSTAVTVNTNRQGAAVINGGLMVYATSLGAPHIRGARHMANETQELNWMLPNGTYQFLALAYDTSMTSGDIRCANGGVHTLGGGNITITLNFSTSHCGDHNLFQTAASDLGGGSNNQPKPILFVPCANTGGNLTALNETGPNNVCDNFGGRPAASDGSASYRISIPEYDYYNDSLVVRDGAPSIESACFTVAAGAHNTNNIKILPGVGNSPFVMGINLYSSGGCTGNQVLFGFKFGLHGATNPTIALRYRPSGSSTDTPVAPPADPMLQHYVGTAYNWVFLREHTF